MGLHYNAQPDNGWVKVFRHFSGNGEFFSYANDWSEAKLTNQTNPNADKFSILSKIDNMKLNGEYVFKLVYPNENVTNIWAQKNNPVTDIVNNGGVINYRPISIQSSAGNWGGLEICRGSTFLDGSVNTTNWYYGIGVAAAWGGTNTFPGANGSTTQEVELWIKIRD